MRSALFVWTCRLFPRPGLLQRKEFYLGYDNFLLLKFGCAVGAAGCFNGYGAKAVRAFLCGWLCSWSRGGSFLCGICCFDDHKNDKGNDEKIDYGLDEQSPVEFHTVDHGNLLAEVDSAHDASYQRHEDIIDQ